MPEGAKKLTDKDVFLILEKARAQYEAYVAAQPSLSAVLEQEQVGAMPKYDESRQLGLVIQR